MRGDHCPMTNCVCIRDPTVSTENLEYFCLGSVLVVDTPLENKVFSISLQRVELQFGQSALRTDTENDAKKDCSL